MKGIQLGKVFIEYPLALGPMAGVTDLPFRLLCREQGAGLVYTEMVSAKAILYRNKNTGELMRIHQRPESRINLLISWISIWAVRFPRW